MIDLTRIRALSFDCYGTLIDWEQGIVNALRPWLDEQNAEIDDAAILNLHAQLEPEAEAEHPDAPYPQILAAVHHKFARRLDIAPDDDAARAFSASVGDWPAFPDSAEALARLSSRFALIIASNVDHESFAGSQRRLGVEFDEVVTAQDVGAYKPDHAHFHEVQRRLETRGIAKDQWLHVAQSLYHDHVPAAELGLASVWINRPRAYAGGDATPSVEGVTPSMEFRTIAEFADEVDRQFAAL